MTGARLPVRLHPLRFTAYEDAVHASGGILVDGDARALVWSRHGDPEELGRVIDTMPSLEWVQLPSAGVDGFVRAGVLDPRLRWTSAKGAYAQPVAEHALALTLALLRSLPMRARATSWGAPIGRSLHGLDVLVLGGGGIARAFAALLGPFAVRLTVCRRSPGRVPFADRTIVTAELDEAVREVDVLVLAAPLSAATRGIVDLELLRRMRPDAVIVNVGRGGLVVTDDLVRALADGTIAGAGLDVTDPEPLPDGHPLWSSPRVLITPHSADTEAMIVPLLAERIQDNVDRFRRGAELVGAVDVAVGY